MSTSYFLGSCIALLTGVALALPLVAFAGSQSYTTPGTYTFSIPAHSSLSVTVRGAGAGTGGGGAFGTVHEVGGYESPGGLGEDGGYSSFSGVWAGGGKADGTNGTASGGDTNVTGGGGAGGGGSGGSVQVWCINEVCSSGIPGDGTPSGSGGLATKTYSAAQPSGSITVVVGAGGAGGAGGCAGSHNIMEGSPGSAESPICAENGASGENGSVTITWTDVSAPTCSVTFDQNPTSSGGSTTIHWSSTGANLFHINNIGYVGASGQAQVSPSQTTDYSGSVSGAGGTGNCAASLAVQEGCSPVVETVTQSAHTVFTTPGSSTFTVPNGVTHLRVAVVGGGGGGGAGGGGWGSGGGGGCGGAIAGGSISVTPRQEIPFYVGYGGVGGNGAQQCTTSGFPWCGTYHAEEDGGTGGDSAFGSIVARGGGWGRTGFYNLYNQHSGGSGGGGGGNGWPGFWATPGGGGTAGGQTNSQGAGGYCTGGGWDVNLSPFITQASFGAGAGGYAPTNSVYWGGGGGGGLVIDGSTVKGGDGQSSPNNGGKGYGAGGGGSNIDNLGVGGGGAPGLVYVEWDGGPSTPGDDTGNTDTTCEDPTTTQQQCTPTSYTCQSDGNLRSNCGTISQCPQGCSMTTNQCNNVCIPQNVCDSGGTKVLNSCTGALVENCTARGAGWRCLNGMCTLPPITFISFPAFRNGTPFTATGHLQVAPALVSSGGISHVYWNVENAQSCTVTGENGDGTAGSATGLWNSLLSGANGKDTSPITEQTIYTLRCTALPGATPAVINETAIVNIVPTFEEQ